MQDLLTPLETGEAEMVMGSRMLIPGAARRGKMPLYKFYGNKVLTWTENKLAGTHFSEFHSGYRAYSVKALGTIPLDSLTTNWHFDTQIILEFIKHGQRVIEVPIPTYYGDEICRVERNTLRRPLRRGDAGLCAQISLADCPCAPVSPFSPRS